MKSKFWVKAKDKFLSGWGEAEGKTSIVLVECDSFQESAIVFENFENRNDMNFIRVYNGKKPYYNPKKYHVAYWNKENAGRMFEKGGFKK